MLRLQRLTHPSTRSICLTHISRRTGLLTILLLVGVSACTHNSANGGMGYSPLYSPNGEPLSGGALGRPNCKEAISRWFDRIDANHDGRVDLSEFLGDARVQFAAMDLDKDGFITPPELSIYRAPYAAAAAPAQAPRPGARPHAARGQAGGAPQGRGDTGGSLSDEADPVMVADTSLRNQVSLADFLSYADRRFAALDANHDGQLTREEALSSCRGRP